MFGTEDATSRAYVLFLNGFLSSSARDIFAALGRLPGAPQSVEGTAQFLSTKPPAPSPTASPSPSSSPQKPQQRQRQRRLVLVVHNIDAPTLCVSNVHALLNPLVSLAGDDCSATWCAHDNNCRRRRCYGFLDNESWRRRAG